MFETEPSNAPSTPLILSWILAVGASKEISILSINNPLDRCLNKFSRLKPLLVTVTKPPDDLMYLMSSNVFSLIDGFASPYVENKIVRFTEKLNYFFPLIYF